MLQIGFEEFLLDFFLPFTLIFSIFYVLLQQLKIFGDPTSSLVRKTNAIIAISISILVVLVNPFGISFRLFLSELFSGTAIVALGLVFLIFFSTLISLGIGVVPRWIPFLLGMGLVILVFSTTGVLGYFKEIALPRGLDMIFIGILLFLIVFRVLSWLFRAG